MDYTVQGILQVRILEWVAHSLLQGIFPTQGSPALQVDSLPAEPPGKPKNTGVDSLSLLQWVFLIQELNQGLLHCRWILYQLSYQGGPYRLKTIKCTFLAMTSFLSTQGFHFFYVNWFLNLKIFYPTFFTICIYVCTYMGLPW